MAGLDALHSSGSLASTSDVLIGIQSWLSVLDGRGSFLSRPGAGEISFLHWQALGAFASPSQDNLHVVVEIFSCGGIICRD
jgi:hypothetical protein